jgi:predicted transcriptional regulator
MYRLERKQAVRRLAKVGNAHLFEPLIARNDVRRHVLDTILGFFGGRVQPMLAQLVDAQKLSLQDIRDLEKRVRARRTPRSSRRKPR